MAHQVIGDKVVVDWTTGDPEGDRITLLAAYRDFIKEIELTIEQNPGSPNNDVRIKGVFVRWNINTENQIDEVPRIWIKRPNAG
jgi:hypothetical protein